MRSNLEGQIAVVTGASRGIGKAIASCYAENGATVIGIARHGMKLENVVSMPCDVTDYEALAAVFKQIDKKYGGIDILVIDAGTDCENQSIEDLDISDWKMIMDVNLNGAFYTAKAAIPYLKKRGGGKIITLGSGIGHKGRAGKAPYSCSKAGLWMLTRILAQELRDFHISVNELIPGPVDTSMKADCGGDAQSAFHIPGEWVKSPEEVTDMALFLALQPMIGPTAQTFSLMRRDI